MNEELASEQGGGRTGGGAQVVGCLPSKHEALSSNMSTEGKGKTTGQITSKLSFLHSGRLIYAF
jgi:hypothetical protein